MQTIVITTFVAFRITL